MVYSFIYGGAFISQGHCPSKNRQGRSRVLPDSVFSSSHASAVAS